MSKNVRLFSKMFDELTQLGVSPRLAHLYGKLVFHAGEDGKCCVRHVVLAREIGLKADPDPKSKKSQSKWVTRLVRRLRELKLVEWTTQKYGHSANEYRILAPNPTWITTFLKQHPRIREVAGKPPLEVAGKPPHRGGRAATHKRRGSSSEVLKEESPTPTPPPGAGADRAKPTAKPRPEPHPEKPKTKTQAKENGDDERTKAQARFPVVEFRRRLKERHPRWDFDVERCILHVQRQLDKASVPWADFLAYDEKHTTTPQALLRPIAFYVGLARDLRNKAVAAVRTTAPDAPCQTAPPEPECTRCKRSGVLPDGGFCSCPMGRDVEKVERRKTQPEKKPSTVAPRKRRSLDDARSN